LAARLRLQVFGRQKNRQPVVIDQMYGRFPDQWHHENFISCVRSRSTPNSDIEEGHRSALICHAANISYRIGNNSWNSIQKQSAL